jgi:hypothetical protein
MDRQRTEADGLKRDKAPNSRYEHVLLTIYA